MAKPQAYSVMFQGYGLTEEGGGVFVFALPNGRMMPLALTVDQVPRLLTAAAAVAGKRDPAGRDPLSPVIPVERWSTLRQDEGDSIMSLHLPGGVELRFALAPPQGSGIPPEGAEQPAGAGRQAKVGGAPAQAQETRISSEVAVDKGRREIRLSLGANPLSIEEAEKLSWELSQALAVLQ
ncbi:MAG TPA: hypothetical protein VHK66_07875 [Microvirga sp.]|jgi:hypothetical protein|nr:hypothetical protein [Microvirga sp.]